MLLLNSIVLALIDFVQNNYHVFGMDNLYNYVTFFKACYTHPNKVKTQGTCSKEGRWIPIGVVQQEVTSIKFQRKVKVTVKAAVLQGDI